VEIYSGLWDRAVQHAHEAISFNPIVPGWFLYLGAAAEYFGGHIEKALAALDQALRANPRLLFAKVLRVGVLAALDRANDAKAEVVSILQIQPDFSLARFAATQPFKDFASRDRYLNTLREAGLPS
jgi:tetratricopeptide (TPR) repeat protein